MTEAPKSSFVYATYIRTTPEKLWAALTTPQFMWFSRQALWLSAQEIQLLPIPVGLVTSRLRRWRIQSQPASLRKSAVEPAAGMPALGFRVSSRKPCTMPFSPSS